LCQAVAGRDPVSQAEKKRARKQRPGLSGRRKPERSDGDVARLATARAERMQPQPDSDTVGLYRVENQKPTASVGCRGNLFPKEEKMPKYVIEREIPGAGKLTADELKAISQKSCTVLRKLGPEIQWIESYVTGDKIYCVYIAPNAEAIREHAEQGGFPANSISEVTRMIDPTTAE
jgi:hypothetical protein